MEILRSGIVLLLIGLTSVVIGTHLNQDEAKIYHDSRIVNGTLVPPGEMSFMVALYINVSDEVKFHCGGSMISQYHVVTAAHCVQGWYAERFTVRWSSNHDLASPSSDERIITVDRITEYFFFYFLPGSATPTNDIALLTLSELLEVSPTITLPDQDVGPIAGTMCTTAGWGALEEGGNAVDNLYQVDVEMQSYETCKDVYKAVMKEEMICAGFEEGGRDACGGDSGGPLICNGVLSGIVSWGTGCAQPMYYGVYTNVAFFREWVEKHNYVEGYPEG